MPSAGSAPPCRHLTGACHKLVRDLSARCWAPWKEKQVRSRVGDASLTKAGCSCSSAPRLHHRDPSANVRCMSCVRGSPMEAGASWCYCGLPPPQSRPNLAERMLTHYTREVSHVSICTLLNNQFPFFFWRLTGFFWSWQGRSVSINSERAPWERSRVLKLLPCASLNWKEQRAMLLELS